MPPRVYICGGVCSFSSSWRMHASTGDIPARRATLDSRIRRLQHTDVAWVPDGYGIAVGDRGLANSAGSAPVEYRMGLPAGLGTLGRPC
jgi:hypothetical protein